MTFSRRSDLYFLGLTRLESRSEINVAERDHNEENDQSDAGRHAVVAELRPLTKFRP